MSLEAMKMVLATLEDIFGKNKVDVGAINALRQAIEQAEKQEPAVWMIQYKDRHEFVWSEPKFLGEKAFAVPFYTAPPNREWVGLTDDEVESWRGSYDFFDSSLVRKVEAKLKEKNA
jgi:hypothetical protein